MTPTSSPSSPPGQKREYPFDPAKFAIYATLDYLTHLEGKEFQNLWREGKLVAEGQLKTAVSQAAADAINELAFKMRTVALRAQLENPVGPLDAGLLIERIQVGLNGKDVPPDGPEGQQASTVPDILICLRQLYVMQHVSAFRASLTRSSAEIAAIILAAQERLKAYTLTALINWCNTVNRMSERSEYQEATVLETLTPGFDHDKNWLSQDAKSGAVTKIGYRSVINSAVGLALRQIDSCKITDPKWLRSVPFLKAWVHAFQLLLEAPGVPLRTYARQLLEEQGMSEAEINRGLAAAARQSIIKELHARVQAGLKWHGSNEGHRRH